jgi:hypothetical protein
MQASTPPGSKIVYSGKTCTIYRTCSDALRVYSKGPEYYVIGALPWRRSIEDVKTPVKIPIENISTIFTDESRIFVCTPEECFVAGSNICGTLGIDDRFVQYQDTFVKVDWYPVEVLFECWYVEIKMKDGKWYGIGAVDGGQIGFRHDDFEVPICTEEEWWRNTNIWYPRMLRRDK